MSPSFQIARPDRDRKAALRPALLYLIPLLILPSGLNAQGPSRPESPAPSSATAQRISSPPLIDGFGGDEVWSEVPVVGGFVQLEPVEGAAPSQRTEFQVAYDTDAIYFLVRAFDSAPDSILHALARRDVSTPADEIQIGIDSYHDRRTGYVFALNVSGVKRDIALYADGSQSDTSWDGVWEAATSVDSFGWLAEIRIPFSQLRYPEASTHNFGLAVVRQMPRHNEDAIWPATYSRNQTGDVSQFGTLRELEGLGSSRTIEAIPYFVVRDRTIPTSERASGRRREAELGVDIRARLAPNLSLTATINPDFGQVEADPAVLNLGAFEVFQSERRPFFVEGTGSYRLQLNCYVVVDCGTNEGLFYSRRIGRSPSLSGSHGDASTPNATPIAAAAKLTGRTEGGLTIGMMAAATRRVEGVEEATVEPGAFHSVLSAEQDFREGDAGIRVVATGVRRTLDRWTAPILHSEAYAAALSFRNRFGGGSYEVSGLAAASRVAGSTDAIAETQRNATHYFQQPDAGLTFEPERTSLSGYAGEIKVGKYGGGITRFESSLVHHSSGFDVNDLGYLQRADRTSWSTWGQLTFNTPTRAFQWMRVNGNFWREWNSAGDHIMTGMNFNSHWGFANNWSTGGGFTRNNMGGTLCDRCTRGGPLLRLSPRLYTWWYLNTDNRRAISPTLNLDWGIRDEGRSRSFSVRPALVFRFSPRMDARIGASYGRNIDSRQWLSNYRDEADAIHHVFAHLDQETVSANVRLNYTLNPNLTLQFYGEPFVSRGSYSDVREVSSTPRAERYEDRFVPFVPTASLPTGVHFRQMNANLVVRWEYAPGSSLFLAWAHGRRGSEEVPSELDWREEFDGLFGLQPRNTFLIKVAHWLNW